MFFVLECVVDVFTLDDGTAWESFGKVSSSSSNSLKKSGGMSSSLTVGVLKWALMDADVLCSVAV